MIAATDFMMSEVILGDQNETAGTGEILETCPECRWIIVDPSWQRTADGACRRCGYSSMTGRRELLGESGAVLAPNAVAKICGLSRRRVYDWIGQGWLRAHRVGGRWFVTPEDLAFFTATCRGAFDRLMPSLWDWPELWPSAKPPISP